MLGVGDKAMTEFKNKNNDAACTVCVTCARHGSKCFLWINSQQSYEPQ